MVGAGEAGPAASGLCALGVGRGDERAWTDDREHTDEARAYGSSGGSNVREHVRCGL